MLSRISNLGGGKFGVENAISNLEFWGRKICGGKCYLESLIWGGVGGEGVNLGWKMLSRISNFGGGIFGVENAISNLEFGGWKIWGERFGVENAISNFEFGGGKFGVENVILNLEFGGGGKFEVDNAFSNLQFGGWKIWGGKC